MAHITRRTLLIAATAALTLPAARAAAGTVPDPVPGPFPPVPAPGSGLAGHLGQLGNVAVTVVTLAGQDNTAIHVTLQNNGTTAATLTVRYQDLTGKRRSKPVTITVPPAASRSTTLYGHLTKPFVVVVCDPKQQCVQIGPLLRSGGGGTPRSLGPLLQTVPPAPAAAPAGGA